MSAGSTECEICPADHQCGNPAVSPVSCLDGQYSPPGSAACLVCPLGAYCTDGELGTGNSLFELDICSSRARHVLTTCLSRVCHMFNTCLTGVATQCSSGEYQEGNTCKSCAPGYYCPLPSVGQVPCPSGTFQTSSGELIAAITAFINIFEIHINCKLCDDVLSSTYCHLSSKNIFWTRFFKKVFLNQRQVSRPNRHEANISTFPSVPTSISTYCICTHRISNDQR